MISINVLHLTVKWGKTKDGRFTCIHEHILGRGMTHLCASCHCAESNRKTFYDFIKLKSRFQESGEDQSLKKIYQNGTTSNNVMPSNLSSNEIKCK